MRGGELQDEKEMGKRKRRGHKRGKGYGQGEREEKERGREKRGEGRDVHMEAKEVGRGGGRCRLKFGREE